MFSSPLSSHNVFRAISPAKSSKKSRFSYQVKAHSYRDHEERSSRNAVDANICVLKERIETIRMKERLQQRHVSESAGWNYVHGYDIDYEKHKRDEQVMDFLQVLGTICGTFGFTISTCTSLLFLVSLIVHRL